MEYEAYKFEGFDPFLVYDFFSEGPRGKVKKLVSFKSFDWNADVYNLSVLDVDEFGQTSDTVVTDNKDTVKVFATVVRIIFSFFESYPDKSVFISGNSPARLRLYHIVIGKYLSEWERFFFIFGMVGRDWEVFKRGAAYKAFLVQKK